MIRAVLAVGLLTAGAVGLLPQSAQDAAASFFGFRKTQPTRSVVRVFQQTAAEQTVAVRGAAEDAEGAPVAGFKIEFLAVGSTQKVTAVTGADGKYSVSLAAGDYEIFAHLPGQARPHSGRARIEQRESVTVNVRVPKGRTVSHHEYDFLGEWRITDENGRGIGPAKVVLEALRKDGNRARFPVYVPAGDDEKETDGRFETAPDGRFVFRIRESHLAPENVVALIVTAEMHGFALNSARVFPDLQFSETGHLFAAYPEEDVVVKLKKR